MKALLLACAAVAMLTPAHAATDAENFHRVYRMLNIHQTFCKGELPEPTATNIRNLVAVMSDTPPGKDAGVYLNKLRTMMGSDEAYCMWIRIQVEQTYLPWLLK